MVDNSFDLRLFKAKNQIDDALGVNKRGQQPAQPLRPMPAMQQPMQPQRMPNLGPVPNQQPMQIPGNPQLTPQGVAFSGQQQVGPGMISGGAMVGPQGFGGAGANYGMPVAGGQLNVGASVDPRMQVSQMQAQYQRGPFSVGAQYQPGAGVSGGVEYRQPFAKGGLAVKPVWDKERPKDLGDPKDLSAKKKKSAKARAKAAGRPYPNFVDNMAAARKKGK